MFESLPREIRDIIYGYLGLPVGSGRWEECFCIQCDDFGKKVYPEVYNRLYQDNEYRRRGNEPWMIQEQMKKEGLPVIEHKRRNECLHVTNKYNFLSIGVSVHKALWIELGPLTQ